MLFRDTGSWECGFGSSGPFRFVPDNNAGNIFVELVVLTAIISRTSVPRDGNGWELESLGQVH